MNITEHISALIQEGYAVVKLPEVVDAAEEHELAVDETRIGEVEHPTGKWTIWSDGMIQDEDADGFDVFDDPTEAVEVAERGLRRNAALLSAALFAEENQR